MYFIESSKIRMYSYKVGSKIHDKTHPVYLNYIHDTIIFTQFAIKGILDNIK